MDIVLKSADRVITKARLGQVAFDYIPHPLLRDVDKYKMDLNSFGVEVDNGVSMLQVLLDNSNNQLRQYGSAEELANNLKIYRNFPLKHKIFGSKFAGSYCPEPAKFRSLKSELFIHKHDFIAYLRWFVLENYTMRNQLPSKLLSYLKKHEIRLESCFEFVRYDEEVFNEICDKLERLIASVEITNQTTNNEQETLSEGLQNIINAHLEWFLPYSESKNENLPTIVRIFKDGSQKFVMKSELFKNSKIEIHDQEPLKFVDEDKILQTIDLSEVSKMFPGQTNDMEFIITPIIRAKHAVVPIVTPSGNHCILAADALLEILRRLISALNIFQKANKTTWSTIKEYISLLLVNFPSDIKCKYFIEFSQFNKMKEQADKFWKKYEKKSAKVVRDVGKDGFTVDDLMNELKYLGLTDIFPDIFDDAEDVYEEVNQKKNEEFLRTCDMFDALEKCQLICILNRFPDLQTILHTQKACHGFPTLQCELCSPPKFKNTEWREFTEVTVRISEDEEKPEINWELDCPNEIVLRSNYSLIPNDQLFKTNIKFFILDDEDMRWINKSVKLPDCSSSDAEEIAGCLHSLENFSKCRTKRIYIRSIPWSDHVFTDEVLEIIPIVLKQQDTPINASDRRIGKYRNRWKCNKQYMYSTIDMEEFQEVLEEFDINKSLITIVPDPMHKLTKVEMSENPANLFISVFSPNGKRVMHISQAIFHIFQSVVCGVSWTKNLCELHRNCVNDLKHQIITVMDECDSFDEEYVSLEHVEESIKTLKEHCNYKRRLENGTVDHIMPTMGFNSDYSLDTYHSTARVCKLPVYSLRSWKTKKDKNHIPVWMARLFYMVGWAECLFGQTADHLLIDIWATIVFKIPVEIRETEKANIEYLLNVDLIQTVADSDQLMEIVKKKIGTTRHRKGKTDVQSTSVQDLKRTIDKEKKNTEVFEESKEKLKGSPIEQQVDKQNKSSESCLDLKNGDEFFPRFITTLEDIKNDSTCIENSERTEDSSSDKSTIKAIVKIQENSKVKSQVEQPNLVSPISKKEAVKPSDQSKCCSKCLRTSERCNEAKTELKLTQNKLKTFEKKASKYDEMEKKLKEIGKENEMLKKSVVHDDNEKEELKVKISKNDATEKKLKSELKYVQNSLKTSEEKVSAANNILELKDTELREMVEKNEELEKEMIRLNGNLENVNKNFEKEILENKKVISELQRKNMHCSIQIEEHERTIDRLIDRISSTPTMFSNSSRTTAPSNAVESYRGQLLDLRKIKDTLRNSNLLKESKDMVEKLIRKAIRPEIKQLARYEMVQVEGKFRNYLQAVEWNIQKIKKTGDSTDLSPLPEYPSLSERFMKEYWSEIDKEPSTLTESTSTTELIDFECLICLANMETDDETIKCENCRRRFHSECASEWLKRKSVCPACSRGLLDPTEFPTLG